MGAYVYLLFTFLIVMVTTGILVASASSQKISLDTTPHHNMSFLHLNMCTAKQTL